MHLGKKFVVQEICIPLRFSFTGFAPIHVQLFDNVNHSACQEKVGNIKH